MSEWEYRETELWRHGENGIALYHVFGLVAAGNVVLAFAEAREGDGGDAGCIHSIYMRRSTDGGQHFEASVCLCSGKNGRCWVNPVPVYDAMTERVFLFLSDNRDNRCTENYVITSDDLGISWSKERRINDALEIGQNPPRLHLAGPGHGIQIKGGIYNGRLVIPFWHRIHGVDAPVAERGYCISVIYSDDHGKTWQQTDYMGQEYFGNESRIGQTADGLLWIIRSGPCNPVKYKSVSLDGGENWSEGTPVALGAANCCDSGLVCFEAKNGYESMTILSRVSQLKYRRDMEILISRDGGATFPESMKLPSGDVMPGYSDLCVLEEAEPVVGLLHCRENHVLFSRISLQTLTGGKYENTRRKVWQE